MATSMPECELNGASVRARVEALLAANDTEALLDLMCSLEARVQTEAARAGTEAARAGTEAARAEAEAARAVQFVEESDTLGERVRELEDRVKHLTRLLYGRRSEKLTKEDLDQLLLAFGGELREGVEPQVPVPASPDESATNEEPPEGKRRPKKRRPNHHGRVPLPPNLERRVAPDILVPEDERACACCGVSMEFVHFVTHETLEFVPAQLIVVVERREKLACKNKQCLGDIVTAERQDLPKISTRVGTSVLVQLIEGKVDDALPIYRQRDQFRRYGLDLPLNTLYGYWNFALDLLFPVAEATLSRVLDDSVVRIDDTGIPVLDKGKPTGKFRGHLWAFKGIDTPLVAYQFTKSWEVKEIEPWIAAISGFIQVDDYKGYSSDIEGVDGQIAKLVPFARRLGCMMHVRRRYYEAFVLGDKRADRPLDLIRRIYAIEAIATRDELDADGRHALRQRESIPLLAAFYTWVAEQKPNLGKTSKLAQAVRYAEQQRPFVERCFTDGRFEIDNGEIERTLKKACIGRRNFLHTGSIAGGIRLATAYTLVQSCRALGISTREYLTDVIEKLSAGWPLRRLSELVPDRWAANRGLSPAPE